MEKLKVLTTKYRTMLVSDIMRGRVVTVDLNETLRKTARLMGKKRIGCVVVTKNGKVTGILTERDVLLKVVAKGRDASKVRARDIMTSPVVTITPDREVEDVAATMASKKIRRLPVVKNQKLVGIVTSADLVSLMPDVDKILLDMGDFSRVES